MPRIRLEFAKGEQARFVSHLEMAKTFERAIRRADLPIAFSEGFNPHPKIAFASALAVGVTSDGEIVDIELTRDMTPENVVETLAGQMPPGIELKQVALVDPKAPSLMAIVNRAFYETLVEIGQKLSPEQLDESIAGFMNLEEIEVEKHSKKGTKIVNIRPGIFMMKGELLGGTVKFNFELTIGNEGSVRPEDVLKALEARFPMGLDVATMVIHRTGLAVADQNQSRAPFEAGLLG